MTNAYTQQSSEVGSHCQCLNYLPTQTSWRHVFIKENQMSFLREKDSERSKLTSVYCNTYVKLQFSHSVVSDSVTPWTVACQTSLSMRFPRQEYWSGLSFHSPGDLPNPGIESRSPALQADSLPAEPSGKLSPYSYKHFFLI